VTGTEELLYIIRYLISQFKQIIEQSTVVKIAFSEAYSFGMSVPRISRKKG